MAKPKARISAHASCKRPFGPAYSNGHLATARAKGQIFSADFAIAAALFSIALALFMAAGQSYAVSQAASAGSLGLSQASALAAASAANACSPSGQFEGRFSANKTEAFFNSISLDYEKNRATLGLLQGGANYDFAVKMIAPGGELFNSGGQAPVSSQVAVFRRTGIYGSDTAILEVEVWER